jgi:hypothetical protein
MTGRPAAAEELLPASGGEGPAELQPGRGTKLGLAVPRPAWAHTAEERAEAQGPSDLSHSGISRQRAGYPLGVLPALVQTCCGGWSHLCPQASVYLPSTPPAILASGHSPLLLFPSHPVPQLRLSRGSQRARAASLTPSCTQHSRGHTMGA